jgi:hypothetical protein
VISIAVGALQGKLELYLEMPGTAAVSEPMVFEPTHEGLMAMWSFFESMGPVPVHFMPEINDPGLTGLPADMSCTEFVTSARLLGLLGWHSCKGGEA